MAKQNKETQPEAEQTAAVSTGASVNIPEGLDKAFKDNPQLTQAYVSGNNWFFDELLAKSQFDQYQKIDNPYGDR